VLMRLVSLDIANFRVIRRARLDFPDCVIGIIGPNGAGKSSIVEAIAWALYGHQAARSTKDEIKSSYVASSDTCQADLQFEVNGEHYRVIRRLVGKTERPEAQMYCGTKTEAVGSTETTARVETLLGLDLKGFLTSFLARQAELNALSDLAPHKRREHLAGMLGIERLDSAIDRVKADIRISGEKAGVVQRQLSQRESVELRRQELREHVNLVEKQRDTQAGARAGAQKELLERATIYREHESKKSACSQLSTRLSAQKETAGHLAGQVDRLETEIAQLNEAADELQGLQALLTELEPARGELDRLRQLKTRAAHRADLQEQDEALTKESGELHSKQEQAGRACAQLVGELADIPDQVEQLLASSGTELEQARSAWATVKGETETTRRELSRVKDQIVSINQIGPETVCDRCHRPFGDDLPAIREHLETEQDRLAAALETFDERMAAQQSRGEKLKQRLSELERQARRKIRLQTQLDAARKDEHDLRQRIAALQARQGRVSAQLQEMGEVPSDPVELERVSAKVDQLERTRRRCHELTGSLQRLEPARRELEQVREKLASMQATMKRLAEEFEGLGYDEAVFQQSADDLARAQQAFDKERESLVNLTKELELSTRELALLDDQLSALERSAKELETYRSDQFYGEKLQKLLGDFRTHVIARIRPRLAELSGQLFSEMTAGRYSMVELDRLYNLRILDSTQYYGVARFSGGEKDLANLCLRLSISLALTESAGLERSFVILDEVFGSQDEVRRELIFDSLANLKARFPQMLLITHIEDIRDKVECLVEVERTAAGWSEVRLGGNVV